MGNESLLNNSMSSLCVKQIFPSGDVSLCVKQIFPSGDSTSSSISLHNFSCAIPYDVLFPVLSSEIIEWLSNEICTGSSFEFKILFQFAE